MKDDIFKNLFQHLHGMDGGQQSIQDIYSKYLGPYASYGSKLEPQLAADYEGLLDPSQLMDQIGSHYHESPGFKFAEHQALQGEDQAQAAGGMIGSPESQQASGALATHLADEDYQHYLQNALHTYAMGLSGEGELEHQGFAASGDLASGLANYLMNQENLKMAQEEANKRDHDSMWGSILGAAAGVISHFL
ncbi:MAG: hypothetical protein ACPGVV_01930 [Croceimicrobium sp.]